MEFVYKYKNEAKIFLGNNKEDSMHTVTITYAPAGSPKISEPIPALHASVSRSTFPYLRPHATPTPRFSFRLPPPSPMSTHHQRSQSSRSSSSAAAAADEDHRQPPVEVVLHVDTQPPPPPWTSSSSPASASGSDAFTFPSQPPADAPDDPPSRLISAFLSRQRDAGGEMALDMDLEMEELRRPAAPLSRELRVSFKDPSPEASLRRRRDKPLPPLPPEDHPRPRKPSGEVLRCTSTTHRLRTRSRLTDPPRHDDPGRAPSIPRSGAVPRSTLLRPSDDDEDDPFAGEDAPLDLSRSRITPLHLLEWTILLLLLSTLACSLLLPPLAARTALGLHLWKWAVLILVTICGRLVSGWLLRLAVFLLERNFLLRKRLLYFVYGLRPAVRNCTWLGLVLISWHYLFDKKVKRETKNRFLPYITKVLLCLLVAAVFRLIKTLLVKALASSFHVSTYFDRIHDSLFNQYVIEVLSGPPLVEAQLEEEMLAEVHKLQSAGVTVPPDLKAAVLPNTAAMQRAASECGRKSMKLSRVATRREVAAGVGAGAGSCITIDHLNRLNQKNVSAWNMKRLMRIVRNGTLTTLDEHATDACGDGDESAVQILSEYEAKAAAKKIFTNVAKPGSKFIYLIDLMRFLREDEAIKTMDLFDGAQETKRISKSALKNWLVNAFRERRALSLTLNDTKTAVKKLHQMVDVVVGIIILIIWLLILGIASTHLFVLISSQLLLAVFIFGNTCKTTFEAIIFLFVMHPFDVGDRCEVDGVHMVVEEMNILTTIFLRFDGQKITYPNSVLSTKVIGNFYRSPDMGESIDFCIHVSTPVEKISTMKERIKRFIECKPEHWHPSPTVMLRDVEDMNRLKVSIWLQHRMNLQDMGERWNRREMVLQEMVRVLRELDIDYRALPVDVNVRNMPSITSSRLPSTWANYN